VSNNKSCMRKTTIGGQALIEGILMRGPRKTCIVVRKGDGELVTKEEPVGSSSHGKWSTLPFLRGPVIFFDSMRYGVSALTYSASFFEDDPNYQPDKLEIWMNKKFGKERANDLMMTVSVVLGIAMPVLLFFMLPTLITGLIDRLIPELNSNIVRNLLEGLVRMLIFLAFIILTSKQSDIKRTYMYHGAEHKTIFCYEKGLPLTVENVRIQPRQHPRCGTSFLFVVMLTSILVLSVFEWSNPLTRLVTRLAMLPVIVSISYEFNRMVGRHDNALTRFLRAPGVFLQRFTTNEPDDSMIEVAIDAIKAVIPENEGEDRW